MDFQMDASSGYRVEVSGWDAAETFFVEKTVLDWEGEGKKEIVVRRSLREGCVVFVRLLQPITTGITFPIAYQTRIITDKDSNGRTRVGLERLRPRPAYKDTIELSVKTTIRVA
jgi:hypothetical protein